MLAFPEEVSNIGTGNAVLLLNHQIIILEKQESSQSASQENGKEQYFPAAQQVKGHVPFHHPKTGSP